ncbi:MAG TPA: SidA/IucD/PvdA family monooxygenase, partial [Thermoanaerobaculia bacterium]|nr:SidA/IucD/PvdA family monooxygenase [Thermoanaerobaculia bacterium]
MRVEAIVSGQANVALFWEGDALFSLHPGGEPVRRRERDIAYLLGDARDLLHFEGVDRSWIAEELDLEVRRADALHLALMLLDAELEVKTRFEAAAELEELFADARVSQYVKGVLYSRSLPGEADIRGACQAAQATSRVSMYLSELVRFQAQIADAWIAWQGIPDELFARSEDRQQALNAAVRSGSFHRLAGLLYQSESVDLLLAEAFADSEVRAVPKYREIWNRWLRPLREESNYPAPFPVSMEVAERAATAWPLAREVRSAGSLPLVQRRNTRTGAFDVIGVGFGPSNLALAVALEEAPEASQMSRLFLDGKMGPVWHPGMLLEDSLIQISVLKDLATVRNPQSRFTFLNYLKEKGRLFEFLNLRDLFPSRIEFNDYLAWVAEALSQRVRWGTEVTAIHPEPGEEPGSIDLLRVVSRDLATGESQEMLTRNIVLTTGGIPAVPPPLRLVPGGQAF